MAVDEFAKGTYANRVSEFPTRRKFTGIDPVTGNPNGETKVYDVELEEGTVTTEGTVWDKLVMDSLEERIYNSVHQIKGEFTLVQYIQDNSLQTTTKNVPGAINEVNAKAMNIAPEFSEETTYAQGAYCIYQNVLYKCTTAVTVAGAWDSTKWSATKVSSELASGGGGGGASIDDTTTALDKTWSSSKISTELSGKQNTLTAGTGIDITSDTISVTGRLKDASIASDYDSTATYSVGDYCIYDGLLYVCDTDISTAEDWDSTHWTQTNVMAEMPSTPWTDVTGTLSAGSTSITLSDASITTTSTIEVFNDLDVPYDSKTLATGSITLTFEAQQSNMSVKVRVT